MRKIKTYTKNLILLFVTYWVSIILSPTLQAMELVSVDTTGIMGGNESSWDALGMITPDGRYVFFHSEASNLVTNDTNGNNVQDVFVRDFQAGTTSLIAMNSNGVSGNGESLRPSFTPDGRYVSFASDATDLVSNDINGHYQDVFVRDLQTGTTTLVSVNAAGTGTGNGSSTWNRISEDGRFVVFNSDATNLVTAIDTNFAEDIFVRDLQTDTTKLVSVNAAGTGSGNQGGFNEFLSMSADGRFLVFASGASDLVTNDTNQFSDVFVRDLQSETTTLVSSNTTNTGSGNSFSYRPIITPNGRYVIFLSWANDLVNIDNNDAPDIFVRDLLTGTTKLVTINVAGTGSGGGSCYSGCGGGDWPFFISPDGRYVIFQHNAIDLVNNDANGNTDVFIRDLLSESTTLVSLNAVGTSSGNGSSNLSSGSINFVSSDGRYVVFDSYASDLVENDTNGNIRDVFVRDLQANTTTLLSTNNAGTGSANDESSQPAISGDGRYAVFSSLASDLVTNSISGHFNQLYRVALPNSSNNDADGDGIQDSIDTEIGIYSDSFADNTLLPSTTGSITDRGGLEVSVSDSLDANEGVIITVGPGMGMATSLTCGFPLELSPGSRAVITCGSITLKLLEGSARVLLDGGESVVNVSTGTTTKITENTDGTDTVENLGGDGLTIAANGITASISSGSEVIVGARFEGFYPPIDNNEVLNQGKAGIMIPLKWRLTKANGSPITDLASVTLSVKEVACSVGTITDNLEEIAIAETGLQNLGNGYYLINWKTSKNFAGSCKTLKVTFDKWAIIGTALFKFK